MNIVQELKNSVLAATELTLHYGDDAEINDKLDFSSFPCAYAVAIDSSTLNMEAGPIRERPTLIVAFVSLQENEDSEEAETLIEARKQDAFKWLDSLRRSTTLRLVSVNQAGRLYKMMDTIICGYSLNITIEELEGYLTCP